MYPRRSFFQPFDLTKDFICAGIDLRQSSYIPGWFERQLLKQRVNQYYESEDSWLLLMMRSTNEFDTFSEYCSYVSWVNQQVSQDISFYPYKQYGATTEIFFDDGTGLFSAAFKRYQHREH